MDAYEAARRKKYAEFDAEPPFDAEPLKCAIFERFDIEMTQEQANYCSHQGNCDEDVEELIKDPDILAQIERIGPDDIREELAEYGAWDEEELADDEENALRILWIAAGNIAEDEECLLSGFSG